MPVTITTVMSTSWPPWTTNVPCSCSIFHAAYTKHTWWTSPKLQSTASLFYNCRRHVCAFSSNFVSCCPDCLDNVTITPINLVRFSNNLKQPSLHFSCCVRGRSIFCRIKYHQGVYDENSSSVDLVAT